MSLAGRAVLVTRRGQDELVALLSAAQATPLIFPCLEIAPPADRSGLDRVAAGAQQADLLAFVSERALELFLEAAARAEVDLRAIPAAAVGRKTAEALKSRGFSSILCPEQFRAEALLSLIEARFAGRLRGLRVIVPRAPEGRPELVVGLEALGAVVEAPETYRLVIPGAASEAEIAEVARAEIATFLSGRAIQGFLERVGPERGRAILEGMTVAVIGPVARARAEELGVRVDVVPPEATAEALVVALSKA